MCTLSGYLLGGRGPIRRWLDQVLISRFGTRQDSGKSDRGEIKEGILLRNVSPSLVLCDHFPGGGILELQIGSS